MTNASPAQAEDIELLPLIDQHTESTFGIFPLTHMEPVRWDAKKKKKT